MHEGRFPFFSRPLRSLTIQGLLDTLSDAFINLLQATDYAPYGWQLKPYSSWIDSKTIYLTEPRRLCAFQDLLIFVAHALSWPEEVFLSPQLLAILRPCGVHAQGTLAGTSRTGS